jgi:hypothetical protein
VKTKEQAASHRVRYRGRDLRLRLNESLSRAIVVAGFLEIRARRASTRSKYGDAKRHLAKAAAVLNPPAPPRRQASRG